MLSGLVRRYPKFFVDHFNEGVPPADRRWLSTPSVNKGAVQTLREALRPGVWGYVQDIRVLARPWGFALEDIQVPVQLWHGDQDRVIPLHHGRYLASVIPVATLRVCPGEAHMLMWNHLAEILMDAAGMQREFTNQQAPALSTSLLPRGWPPRTTLVLARPDPTQVACRRRKSSPRARRAERPCDEGT